MDRIKKWFDRTDPVKFWVHMTANAFVVWGLTGIMSLVNGGSIYEMITSILSGVASCWVFASAVLAVTEKKFDRPEPVLKQKKTENRILFFMLIVQVLAEFVNCLTGEISYALPLTLAGLSLFACILFAGPHIWGQVEEKMKTPEILKIIMLGTAATLIVAMFIRMTVEVFAR